MGSIFILFFIFYVLLCYYYYYHCLLVVVWVSYTIIPCLQTFGYFLQPSFCFGPPLALSYVLLHFLAFQSTKVDATMFCHEYIVL